MYSKSFVLAALLGLGLSHPINEEIVKEIRQKTSLWTAHDVKTNPIAHWTEEEIKGRLGTILQKPFGF